MDLIILNDGLYSLVPVTKAMLEHIKIMTQVDCFDLCEIIRIEFTIIEVPVDKRTKMIAVFSPEIRILVLRFHAFRCLKSREYKLRVVCGLEVSPGL